MATRKTAAKAATKPAAEPQAPEGAQQQAAEAVVESQAGESQPEGAALLATGVDFAVPPPAEPGPVVTGPELSAEELGKLKPGPVMVMPTELAPMGRPPIERMAMVCHEVNRAICRAMGDDSQQPWDDAPDWQRESAIKGVLFAIDNPDASPADQHAAWCRDKIAAGWAYGPTKDAGNRTHPCLVAYDLLPPMQKAKDYAFRAVVRAMAG